MINLTKVEKFEPFGQTFCRQHPFTPTSYSSSSVCQDGTGSTYKWKLKSSNEYPDCYEELFVCNNTVVWSRGKYYGARTVIKCYTAKSPLLDCMWCSFQSLPAFGNTEQDKCLPGGKLDCLCMVQSDCIDVLSKDGAMYTISLPFMVAQTKSFPGGLLLERGTTPGEVTLQKRDVPTVFSVLHPLDEPRPVTSKVQGKVSYLCDPTVNVVFTCESPALVLTYDSVIGLHSLWQVTRARAEDCPDSPSHMDLPELHFSNILHHPTPVLISAGAHSRLSAATPTQSFSPFKPYTPTSAMKAHTQSPAPPRLMSPSLTHLSVSRIMSPSVGSLDSPFGIGLRSPLLFRTPPASGCSSREESSWDSFQPLRPDVCFTQVWQEAHIAVRYGTKGKASKVFLTQDKCGATFLCYLLGQLNKLRGVQIVEKTDHIQFENTFEIPAKDAIPVEELKMMVVLEPSLSLVLYSGPVKACQVRLPSFPVTQPDTLVPFETNNEVLLMSSVEGNDRDIKMMEVERPQEFQSPNKCVPQTAISALRDPIHRTCNLVLTDGSIYRVTLPSLSQNLVDCLEVLNCILPSPLVVQVHLTYYTLTQSRQSHDDKEEFEWFSECMLDLLGFPIFDKAKCDSPGVSAAKKSKLFPEENNITAWEMLINSSFHKEMKLQCRSLLSDVKGDTEDRGASFPSNTLSKRDALLFDHIPTVLFAWNLIYEELKLNLLKQDSLRLLAKFLCRLAKELGWDSHVEYYSRDFPSLFASMCNSPPSRSQVQEPVSILQWLYGYLSGKQVKPFPVLPGITKNTFIIITLYSLLVPLNDGGYLVNDPDKLFKCVTNSGEVESTFKASFIQLQEKLKCLGSAAHKVVAFLAENGVTCQDLDCFPFGVVAPIREALHQCAADPPLNLLPEAYHLIGREDLASQVTKGAKNMCFHSPLKKVTLKEGEADNGFNLDEEVMTLRFGKDLRIQEVQRLLQSSKPVTVNIIQKPEVSDHDFIQEQENRLLMICKRTMSLPVGRGMFTMATSLPVLTETLPIPTLDLTGRAPPRNTGVSLEHVEAPADMKIWPQFHNGVAAGLRIAQGISPIDSTWIVYNKPKNGQLSDEHAGFLMALGLNGHLKNLSYMNVHDYLCKGHELTTVGLLLGTAAATRGTMDITATKMLSIHLDALLPPTSAELDVPHSAQVAAILGVGLVYQGTAQRRMSEVLLSEIGRPPGPEMENAVNRESYSLAAGLALGLVMLQHGNEAASVADLKIADQLYHYMIGGQTKPQTGTQKEKFKSPSYQIKEGDSVNINVTGPGATLALGLMFMKTNNSSVAAWLSAPDTQFMLDFIPPDFLLLRLVSHGLILWDSIHPSTDWVESHIPAIVYQYDSCTESEAIRAGVDLESLSQAKVNIIAGCCMAMGLRFAGSANQDAFSCLIHYTKYCKDLLGSPAVEQAGKPTVETCLNTILLSLAMVMAGTGNLDVLRIARQLRKRHSPDVHYGSHMAVHMAIGLLFLGGGRFTLNTSGAAVASLLCAFYPRFPISSSDNRYHLQAFRHLYVLAAEPRVIVPREVDTNKACYVPLEVTLKETQFFPETCLKLTAPCIVPELHLIKKIRVTGSRYWTLTIDFTQHKSIASLLTSKLGTIYVKRRTGFLSYGQDPKGHRNILAKTFAAQTEKIELVRFFSSDANIIALTELFCAHPIKSAGHSPNNFGEQPLSNFIASALVEAVTEDKADVLKTLLRMWQIVNDLPSEPDPGSLWQIKLLITFYRNTFTRLFQSFPRKPLVNFDFIEECKFLLEESVDQLMHKESIPVKFCFSADDHKRCFCAALCCFAVYHDVPLTHNLPAPTVQQDLLTLPMIPQDSGEPPVGLTALLKLQAQT